MQCFFPVGNRDLEQTIISISSFHDCCLDEHEVIILCDLCYTSEQVDVLRTRLTFAQILVVRDILPNIRAGKHIDKDLFIEQKYLLRKLIVPWFLGKEIYCVFDDDIVWFRDFTGLCLADDEDGVFSEEHCNGISKYIIPPIFKQKVPVSLNSGVSIIRRAAIDINKIEFIVKNDIIHGELYNNCNRWSDQTCLALILDINRIKNFAFLNILNDAFNYHINKPLYIDEIDESFLKEACAMHSFATKVNKNIAKKDGVVYLIKKDIRCYIVNFLYIKSETYIDYEVLDFKIKASKKIWFIHFIYFLAFTPPYKINFKIYKFLLDLRVSIRNIFS